MSRTSLFETFAELEALAELEEKHPRPWELISGLKLPVGVRGRWSLTREEVPAGHVFTVNNLRDVVLGGAKGLKVKFDEAIEIHRLREHNGRSMDPDKAAMWVSDHPAEVYSISRALEGFGGRVLVGGLGIGLAVAILESNTLVREIVVVERSPAVKALVWPHLKTKRSRIVVQDLFKYLRTHRGHFDWAFYDIWIDESERTFANTVMPLYRLSSGLVTPGHVRCWKSEVMLVQIRTDIEVQLTLYEASGASGTTTVTGGGNAFRIPEDRFREARHWPSPWLGLAWAYYNWARNLAGHPSIEELRQALTRFMAALTDPEAWDRDWARWYADEGDKC